jgi:hypothetical protein
MEPQYRYSLEKGSKKFPCPRCRKKSFKRYKDNRTGEYLPGDYGRCDHENKCRYHLNPYQDGYVQKIGEQEQGQDRYPGRRVQPPSVHRQSILTPPVSFVPDEIVKATFQRYGDNNLIKYLAGLFGVEVTGQLLSKYPVGTSKHWHGANIFWQMDISGRCRAGKIMLYDASTGKRIKEPFDHITWVHSVPRQPDFNLRQCFFGEHLLQDITRPVAIVESEKSALIASVYLPQYVWMASGGLDGLTRDKCQVLRGRNVTLYPDLSRGDSAFDKWSQKAKGFSEITNFQVSDYLERIATPEDREAGLDLADYLAQFDYREFCMKEPSQVKMETE